MAGGAWKVAYADFVTALFALFMVLWILGQDEAVKGSVSAYFRDPWQSITRKSTRVIQMRENDVVSSRESNFKADAPVELQHQRINDEEVIKTFMNNKELRENRNIQMERVDKGVLINFFSETDRNLFDESSGNDLALSDYGLMALNSVGVLLARYNLNNGKGSLIEITGHTPEGYSMPPSVVARCTLPTPSIKAAVRREIFLDEASCQTCSKASPRIRSSSCRTRFIPH